MIYIGGKPCAGDPHRVDALIAIASIQAPHMVPLFRLARDGRLTLIMVSRGERLRKSLLGWNGVRSHALCLIWDDDYATTGPSGFPSAATVIDWATSVIIHSAGAGADDYARFGEIACVGGGRIVLVETSSAFAEPWRLTVAALRPHLFTLNLVVPDQSEPHPEPPSCEEVH